MKNEYEDTDNAVILTLIALSFWALLNVALYFWRG